MIVEVDTFLLPIRVNDHYIATIQRCGGFALT